MSLAANPSGLSTTPNFVLFANMLRVHSLHPIVNVIHVDVQKEVSSNGLRGTPLVTGFQMDPMFLLISTL